MKKTQLKLRGGIALAAVMVAGTLWAAPALAQDTVPAGDGANDGPQEIVVTGSRIARRNIETAAPVASVSAEEFKLSGTVNVEQVINTLPQVIPGTTAFSNNPGGGVSTLNLRGLGANRTMVLVNGRRWVSYDTSQVVDLNTIPAFLIDRVEVVSGGASAVYGSDALAGVVNFTLNNNLDGMLAGGQYSVTGRGDGPRYEAYVAMGGKLGDRGHATVYAEYFKREAIFQGARSFSRSVLGDGANGLTPAGSSTTPNGRVTSTYTIGDGGVCPTGNVFCSPGAYYTAPGVSRPRTGADLYNYAPDNYLQVPQERYMLGGFADYEIADGHTAYAEVTYVNNRVANELAPTPVTGTFQVNINAVSPFLSARDIGALRQLDTVATADNIVGDGVVPLAIQRRVNETGSRNSLDERNAFRVLAGVRGSITDSLNYDVYYSYARTRNANVQAGNISKSAFQAGLNGTASAINIFGPGALTKGMVDQISILAQNGDTSELKVFNASLSGNVFNFGLGADDVGFAFGGEYRRMSSQFIPDTALSSGDVIGFNAGKATAGAYSAKELFGELRVPIVANKPFIHELELNGAARYSDYSLTAVGGVWAYAAGAKWALARDFAIRGQYQRAVRAPNVGELFGGQAVNFPTAADPCAQASAASNTTVRNLCIATGVPAAAVGSKSLQLNTQIQDLEGGNPNLKQETSDSYTAGVVFTPSFVPGLTATVDWYNIKVNNQISTLGGGLANTLNLCYNTIQNISSAYCQAFVGTRNALGQFDGVNPPKILNANVGKLEVEGVDVEVNYTRALGFGLLAETSRLNLNFMGTYTITQNSTPVAALPNIVNRCAGKFGLVCGNPTAKYKWASRATWVDGMLTSSLRWRHLSGVRDDDPSTDYIVENLPAYDLIDLSFSAEFDKKFTFSIGVNNLFDKQPTRIGDNQQQANTYPSVYDVLGRDFFVSGRFKF